ncbi:guanylate kinase [Desulfuribacillus stibiiarsenatis]|uniref:Guanylate kinase n=1 Tax=Desulfuribacillus stibiiarsenatis TaxID=1390249 RepID=A0A1E5L6F8_9FIRM|nr:guanylate kinase [Desulfuribacillus stibiiarsenatis]OEH85747.1 guanylate kinase [Desulfuribacillus stibiiarsenatis]
MNREEGLLIVLSGPSGVGKGTVCKQIRCRQKLQHLKYSVSATTRAPREGEANGVDYFFKQKEEFEDMINNGELLEWAKYVDNYYGTPYSFVQDQLKAGYDVILEIEVQGALQVRKRVGKEGIFIFLVPPNVEELKRRILERASETDESMNRRLKAMEQEMKLIQHYDYCVVNDDIQLTCELVESIVNAEHCKVERNKIKYEQWL